MNKTHKIGIVLALALAGSAAGDWGPGDPHKMHFPQLPDPNGWDVNMTFPKVLADDWKCSETGPVTDVHFWFSFQKDIVVPIESIHVSIHKDVPVGPGGHSHPGDLLWERNFSPTQFKVVPYGQGEQGWYDPNTGEHQKPDHFNYFQANIEGIIDPFVQQFGTIYWLDLSVTLANPNAKIGWKTSKDHFNDDAVWGDFPNPQWKELFDPITGESLDLAFVITPAPASVALLLGAALIGLRRRR